jgi:LruC domain-containing protein
MFVAAAASLVAACPIAQGATVTSTRLKGVIEKGTGDIDLLKSGVQSRNLTMAQLEAFRRDNGGKLAFAVDVNEAASGSEKASSLGVTVESARLEVTTSAGVVTFDQFSTRTQTSVSAVGQGSRSIHYTLIGDAGSRQITGSTSSDINGSSFDATIRIPVGIDLSTASAARLVVKLLETNPALGDPEAYYDYSGGFEDVAIVTAADAAYLDQLAPGQADAPLVLAPGTSTGGTSTGGSVSSVYFPASNDYYLAAYEDQFPSRGDYDFNDLVVAYRVAFDLDASGNAVAVAGEGFLVARGGGFDSDWHLGLPLPSGASGSGTMTIYAPDQSAPLAGYPRRVAFNGPVDLAIFVGLRTLWQTSSSAFVNTPKEQSPIRGHRFKFELRLDRALSQGQLPQPPFDPYLYVHNTGASIHVADGRTGSVDSAGFPFAMILPSGWDIPVEYVDLGLAYPDFVGFVGGDPKKQAWYLRPAAERTKSISQAVWQW